MRTRLYHDTVPQGMIFTDPKAMQEALSEGWQEAPWLVKQPENGNAINKEKVILNNEKLCECGCGQPVKNRFVLGHAWKAKGKKNGNLKNDQPPD